MFCIATPPGKAMRARALPQAGRIIGHIVACLGRIVVGSWPVHARLLHASLPCLSRYNALYRDSTPEWAVAHSRFHCTILFYFIYLFFLHHFFFSFQLLENQKKKKNKFFFSFSSRTKNIYFKYFFSCFTLGKTSEKNSSTHFFLFNSGLFAQNFLERLSLYFLDPSVQHFFFLVLFTKHTIHTTFTTIKQ